MPAAFSAAHAASIGQPWTARAASPARTAGDRILAPRARTLWLPNDDKSTLPPADQQLVPTEPQAELNDRSDCGSYGWCGSLNAPAIPPCPVAPAGGMAQCRPF